MTHGDGGKGDKQRPTNWDHFSENFDRIFGKRGNAAPVPDTEKKEEKKEKEHG